VKMSYHYSEIEALAAATLGQHLNKKWHVEREGRILASSMRDTIELGHDLQHHILKKGAKLSEDLLQKIRWRRKCLYNYKDFSSRPAVSWGLQKESLARACYEKQTGYRVEETGLWVFPSGSVCCSPDGLVFTSQESKHPEGILEIKCPYKLRNGQVIPSDKWARLFPYLKSDFKLNQEHRLYQLIQAELYATRTNWCDLFLWTPTQTLLVRVQRNEQFIQTNVPLVDWVFENYIYPLCRKDDRKKFRFRELENRDWQYREEVYLKRKGKNDIL